MHHNVWWILFYSARMVLLLFFCDWNMQEACSRIDFN